MEVFVVLFDDKYCCSFSDSHCGHGDTRLERIFFKESSAKKYVREKGSPWKPEDFRIERFKVF